VRLYRRGGDEETRKVGFWERPSYCGAIKVTNVQERWFFGDDCEEWAREMEFDASVGFFWLVMGRDKRRVRGLSRGSFLTSEEHGKEK
jgi:hypothetical protein